MEHPDTLMSMANLASTYMNQGRWKEAEQLEVEVLEARKKVLGTEHQDTLLSMNNLASTYSDQSRWKEAEQLQVDVLETSKKLLGGASGYAYEHEQPGIDVLEPGQVE